MCQESEASDSAAIVPPLTDDINSHIHGAEINSMTCNDKSTITDTDTKRIQNLEKLANNLQGQVIKFEQEKKHQINQWEDQAKSLKEKIIAL